jgi:hypothetical protein
VTVDGRRVGVVREVALDAPVWASPAFGAEVTLGAIESAPVAQPRANVWHEAVGAQAGVGDAAHVRYRPLPTTPAAELDLALVVPDAVAAARVEEVLRRSGGDTLERVALLDEFRGGDVPAGARSLLWRLTLRDPVRTLRQKEVDGRRQKLVQALERELGVRDARADVAGPVSRTPPEPVERRVRRARARGPPPRRGAGLLRAGALDAERRLRELTAHAPPVSAGAVPAPAFIADPAQSADLRTRVAALESENGDLRDRLAEARSGRAPSPTGCGSSGSSSSSREEEA